MRFSPWKKHWRLAILLPLLAVGLGVCARVAETLLDDTSSSTPPKVTAVAVCSVASGPITEWVWTVATARATRRELLRFEVPGRVVALGADGDGELREGSPVSGPSEDEPMGQLLARLEPLDAQAELRGRRATVDGARLGVAAARAAIEDTEAQLANVRRRHERMTRLAEQGIVSRSELEEVATALARAGAADRAARAQLEVARSEVALAASGLEQARNNLSRTELRAPFDGVLARLNIGVSDLVAPEAFGGAAEPDLLRLAHVVLIDPRRFELTFEVPVERGRMLREGAIVRFRLPRSTGGAAEQRALVFSISPLAMPPEGMVRVRARFAITAGELLLRDGDVLEVAVAASTSAHALFLPPNALIRQRQSAAVFVVDPETNRVERREVSPGIENEESIEIRSGLEHGEVVVTRGRQRLRDGDIVAIVTGAQA